MSFTFTVSAADWGRIAPLIVLAATALLVLLADLFVSQPLKNQKGVSLAGTHAPLASPNGLPFNLLALPFLRLLGLLGAFAATIILFILGDYQPAFNSIIGSDEGCLFAFFLLHSSRFLVVV